MVKVFYLPNVLITNVLFVDRHWRMTGFVGCSCVNINFAFRGVCNRCGSARPAVNLAVGGGITGGGRGRSRGANDACGRGGRGSGGPPGLFGPNDWNCPMYVLACYL